WTAKLSPRPATMANYGSGTPADPWQRKTSFRITPNPRRHTTAMATDGPRARGETYMPKRGSSRRPDRSTAELRELQLHRRHAAGGRFIPGVAVQHDELLGTGHQLHGRNPLL